MQDISGLTQDERSLIDAASAQIQKSYLPNKVSMAAALRTASSKTYFGVNVKYKEVWKCICAERVAIANALKERDDELELIVVVKFEEADDSLAVVNMCGECRQMAVLHPSLKAIVANTSMLRSVSVGELLPYAYR